MTTSTVQFTEERVKIAGTELYVLKGGSGPPVLVLHGVEGFEGWLPFHDALAEQATVYAPAHPGYGQTPCPEWVETIPHQAMFYHWFLQEQALAPVDVVGIGQRILSLSVPPGDYATLIAGPAIGAETQLPVVPARRSHLIEPSSERSTSSGWASGATSVTSAPQASSPSTFSRPTAPPPTTTQRRPVSFRQAM